MNVLAVGLQKAALEEYIVANVPELQLVETDPAVIISFGGDGTLLYAERLYPGVPKAMIRNSQICHHCTELSKQTILRLIVENQFTIVEHIKLEASVKEKTIIGLNDIILGHRRVNGTVRARVAIAGQAYADEIVGDGVVVSTPLGSTGYYQSITRSNFQYGIGIAFNNTINIVSHLVLTETADIQIEITRGPATVTADNDDNEIQLSTGDVVRIACSQQRASLLEFPKQYTRFNINRGSNRVPLGVCQICRSHYE